jgi:4-carboxymuconolactone decarboxylase
VTRIPLLTDREALDAEQAQVYDRVVESRGSLVRPFQVMLHSPAMARWVAEVGHAVRFESGLDGPDRELAILATARALGCGYIWETHLDHARHAGVSPEAIAALDGREGDLTERERLLVAFVGELWATGTVTEEVFVAVREALGTKGAVELAVTVGYYAMLGLTMNVCGAG